MSHGPWGALVQFFQTAHEVPRVKLDRQRDAGAVLAVANTKLAAINVFSICSGSGCSATPTRIEKKLVPPWDVRIHAWFDLSSDLPPAAIHHEFFGRDGAFRAGPPLEEFDRLFDDLVKRIDPDEAREGAEAIDRWAFDEVAALSLCAPQALYAVNRHVDFKAYRTTFELADTEVSPEHWSRRDGGKARGGALVRARSE